MNTLIFDLEANGLRRVSDGIPAATKIHCIVTKNLETGETLVYCDEAHLVPTDLAWGGSIADGIEALRQADRRIGHNANTGYDRPLIQDLTGVDIGPVVDTQVLGRLIIPQIRVKDKEVGKILGRLRGRHSLEAWGARFDFPKGDYGKDEKGDPIEGAFDELNEDMIVYCARDDDVTERLYLHLKKFKYPLSAVAHEHAFAREIDDQMHRGVGFDYDAALEFEVQLREVHGAAVGTVHKILGPHVTYTKVKRIERRNPYKLKGNQQMAVALGEMYGYKPAKRTPSGLPEWTDDTMANLPDCIPEDLRAAFRAYASVNRALTTLAEGKHALLKSAVDHGDHWRIHPYCNHNGTGPGRCSHSHPNMNLPKPTSPWGPEFRSLIIPRPGYRLVGADISSVDGCMIAHLMVDRDGGKMRDLVMAGSLHEHNLEIMRTVWPEATRDNAKNTFYAVCYGARAKKVSSMNEIDMPVANEIRDLLLAEYPGVGGLSDSIRDEYTDLNYIPGLDGRRVFPDVAYQAMIAWIQQATALIMKQATIRTGEAIRERGLRAAMVLHIHDEYHFEVHPDDVEEVMKLVVTSFTEAGEHFKMLIPITGDAKEGSSWLETH